jgi:hypothetical protein
MARTTIALQLFILPPCSLSNKCKKNHNRFFMGCEQLFHSLISMRVQYSFPFTLRIPFYKKVFSPLFTKSFVIYIRVVYSFGISYTGLIDGGFSNKEIPDGYSQEDAFNPAPAKRDLSSVLSRQPSAH